jgi:signal transduction histidine kinase
MQARLQAAQRAAVEAMSAKVLRQLLVSALVLGFLVLVSVSGVTVWLVARDQDYTNWVNHTYTVERHLSQMGMMFERAEAARRGFLLTREPQYMTTYDGAATGLRREVDAVRTLTADNAYQQQNTAEMGDLLTEKLRVMEAGLRQAQAGGKADNAAVLSRDQLLVDRMRGLLVRMIEEENRLLRIRTENQGVNANWLLTGVLGSGVFLAVLAIGAGVLVRRYAADLNRSQDALQALNEGLEQAVRDRTADLTRANDEIQRFAYIVSHDLRSPLVNVMGFTSELEISIKPLQTMLTEAERVAPNIVSSDARAAVNEDLPEAIGFIRSSTKKMDRLINAILKLSREGRRTLAPEPVDMDAVAQNVTDSLKHQAVERGAEFEIVRPLPALVSDRLAIEQVLSNLVENALKYLKPGRPGRIVVRGHKETGRMIYEVVDNGRGVDPKDHERIFDLFRRSGVQDQPGEGIGLAHVRALVYRLGGTISVDSELDRGSTFRLCLPPKITRDEGPQA